MSDALDLDLDAAREAVRRALAEDLGAGDLTSEAIIPADASAEGVFVAREPGVAAGIPLIGFTFREVDRRIAVEERLADGDRFEAGAILARIRGPARPILAAERVTLNLVGRLCGIATLARSFVDAVAGTGVRIYDTRKTTPGLRVLEKYAVRAGGALNHRMGLFDQALIKDNHLVVLARRLRPARETKAGEGQGLPPTEEVDLREAVAAVRRRRPGAFVEVEVATEQGVLRALDARPDAILLDNMRPEQLRACVGLARERVRSPERRPLLEASGGVRLDNVRVIAETGVDRISVGAITHAARSLDIALEFER